MARIHHVALVRPYDVSSKSQTKQPLTLLWYVHVSELRCRDAFLIGLYYVLK